VEHISIDHVSSHSVELAYPATGKCEHAKHDSRRSTIGEDVISSLDFIK